MYILNRMKKTLIGARVVRQWPDELSRCWREVLYGNGIVKFVIIGDEELPRVQTYPASNWETHAIVDFTPSEYEIFQNFYEDDLDNGRLWFVAKSENGYSLECFAGQNLMYRFWKLPWYDPYYDAHHGFKRVRLTLFRKPLRGEVS